MEDIKRLTEVEKAIVRIDATMANLATSADVQKGFADQTKWIVGSAVVLGALALTIMTFVLNNAIPKAPVAQQQPIVIQMPVTPPVKAASGP